MAAAAQQFESLPAKLIPVSLISESPSNPRKTFGDLTELTESVKAKGVLQPLQVRTKDAAFEVVFGHRRFRAAKAADLECVPALIVEMTDAEALEAQLIELCGHPHNSTHVKPPFMWSDHVIFLWWGLIHSS